MSQGTAFAWESLDAQRICVIKPSALGDVVQALPVLNALQVRFPRAEVTWVINRELAPLLTDQPGLHRTLLFERGGGIRRFLRLLRDLRRSRFDLVFDLQGLARTGLMTVASGAPVRIGLETAREGSQWTCHALIPATGREVPAHARYGRVAEVLGVTQVTRHHPIMISAADGQWWTETLGPWPRPLAVLHPGAKWVTKRWPAEQFTEVALRQAQTFGGTVVLIGGNSERGVCLEMAGAITRQGHRVLNLAGETTLKQLAAVVEGADIVVSNDSGPMHLAAAMGTPVVGLFTCTSPLLSGPPGEQHLLVQTRVPCAAGYHKTCPLTGTRHLQCFAQLEVDRVWSAVQTIQSRSRTARRPA